MNWTEILVTLSLATLNSVLCATIFYEAIYSISIWSADNFIPLDGCVIIAIISAIVGSIGYWIMRQWSTWAQDDSPMDLQNQDADSVDPVTVANKT